MCVADLVGGGIWIKAVACELISLNNTGRVDEASHDKKQNHQKAERPRIAGQLRVFPAEVENVTEKCIGNEVNGYCFRDRAKKGRDLLNR
jgi:hypothetical protein